MSGIVIAETCQYCSRQLSPSDVLKAAGGNMRICDACYEVHRNTLYRFALGERPAGCQECGVTFEKLQAMMPGGNVRMMLVWKDKIYQILCYVCAEQYLPKRQDLFKNTEFGHRALNL